MADKKKKAVRVSKVPANETKRDKFIRLADARVSRVLKQIRMIGNLSASGYEYGQSDIDKIYDALLETVKSTMARFVPRSAEDKADVPDFSLKS